MNKITVFKNPLDQSSRTDYTVEPNTRIIDFLQGEYPDGFGSMIRVFVGSHEIEIEELDRELTEEEQVVILAMPAGPIGPALVQAAISALVSLAVGLVINFLFRPDKPSSGRGDESPVYSIGATQNAARLGEPVPVHYGTVTYPPDYAAAPYIWYNEASNDQFVDELLCLGVGEYTIQQIYLGNAPLASMEAGTVQYWLFGPDDHQQELGVIEDTIWQDVQYSGAPFPFHENLYTSPEVEGWEFNSDFSEEVSSPLPISGRAFAGVRDPVTDIYSAGRIEDVALVDPTEGQPTISAGDEITLSGTASNNITFTVGSVVRQQNDDTLVTLFELFTGTQGVIQNEDPLSGSYTLNTALSNMVAGPYRAQREGQTINRIYLDIVFPNGLYDVGSSGDINRNFVNMQFSYQQLDEGLGTPLGDPVVQVRKFWEKDRNPLRYTIDSGPLIPGVYEVTVERLTQVRKSVDKIEQVTWTGLKGVVVHDKSVPAYGPCTMLAMRIKATNGVGRAAQARIRVRCTRNLTSGASTNPITVIKDIYTDTQTGMGRQESELYLSELDDLETQWSRASGPRFNGSFTQRSTGYEAMQLVASFAASRIVQDGSLLTVIPDQIRDIRSAVYSTANIKRDSLEINYTFDPSGDFDGVQVEYRDPLSFDPLFLKYPPECQYPDTFVIFGCTDEDYAGQMAVYLWNVKNRRRKVLKFTTELEGLVPRFADRIAVSHPLPSWGESGVIVDVLGPQHIRVDTDLTFSGGNVMSFRSEQGVPSDLIGITPGPGYREVLLDSVPTIPLYSGHGQEPTHYIAGTVTDFYRDFMVEGIRPLGETEVQIECQAYDEGIYIGAPPHMSPIVYSCSSFIDASIDIPDVIGAYRFVVDTRSLIPSEYGGGPDAIWAGTTVPEPPLYVTWQSEFDSGYIPPEDCVGAEAQYLATQGATSRAWILTDMPFIGASTAAAIMRVGSGSNDDTNSIISFYSNPGLATVYARLVISSSGQLRIAIRNDTNAYEYYDTGAYPTSSDYHLFAATMIRGEAPGGTSLTVWMDSRKVGYWTVVSTATSGTDVRCAIGADIAASSDHGYRLAFAAHWGGPISDDNYAALYDGFIGNFS